MTKQEQNQIIKDAMVRNLQKGGDIPEDIGEVYANWVIGLVQNSQSQLIQSQQPVQQEQGQSQEQVQQPTQQAQPDRGQQQ